MFKNNRWINIYYTKSEHLQSLDCLFCFRLEIPFLGKFGLKTQIYQFKLKFGTWTNSNMQNSMECSLFFFLTRNTFFGKIWSKKSSKLSVWGEIWYLDQFEYAEFNGSIHFFCLRPEKPFLRKCGPKNQNCNFKLKFGTTTNFNMQNTMTMFTFFCFWP